MTRSRSEPTRITLGSLTLALRPALSTGSNVYCDVISADGSATTLTMTRVEWDALGRVGMVVDAAREWSESFGELSKRLPPHVHRLRDAVDALDADGGK